MLDLKKLIDKVLTFIKPKTGTITAVNNFTLYEIKVMERCGVVSISGYATRSSAIGTSEVRIGTVSGVTFPTHHIRKHTGTGTQPYSPTNNGYVILTESGGLLCKSASTSDRTIVFDFCYVVGGVIRSLNAFIFKAFRGGVAYVKRKATPCQNAGATRRKFSSRRQGAELFIQQSKIQGFHARRIEDRVHAFRNSRLCIFCSRLVFLTSAYIWEYCTLLYIQKFKYNGFSERHIEGIIPQRLTASVKGVAVC